MIGDHFTNLPMLGGPNQYFEVRFKQESTGYGSISGDMRRALTMIGIRNEI